MRVMIIALLLAVFGLSNQTTLADEHDDALAKESSSVLFPDWGSPGMDFKLGPFGGQTLSDDSSDQSTLEQWTIELGLHGAVRNIPLYTGSPGFYLGVHGGYGYGWQRTDGLNFKDTYSRWWIGSSLTAIYHQFKNTVEYVLGKRDWQDESDYPNAKSQFINNTFSVLVLRHLSANYLFSYGRHFQGNMGSPYLREFDNWFYAQLQFSLLNFNLMAGPGVKISKLKVNNQVEEGTITYLKIKGSANLWSLLDAALYGNYIFNDSLSSLGIPAADFRFPTQPINTLEGLISLPRDTLDLNAFVGTSILTGFSIGIHYNLRIANALERDGDRETASNYGYGVNYRYSF